MPEGSLALAPSPETAVQRSFAVEMVHAPDGALRVLGPFVLSGADILSLHLDRRGEVLAMRIVVQDLEAVRAETLRRRLEALPGVLSVGAGWRAAPVSAPPGSA